MIWTCYQYLLTVTTAAAVLLAAVTTPLAGAFVQSASIAPRTRASRCGRTINHLVPTTTTITTSQEEQGNPKVPITLLSGFLGSGKTCTLKHLLENTQGIKMGVIVNDVASVNIDAKLIVSNNTTAASDSGSSSSTVTGIVELQNGCACCSLADEMLTAVQALLQDRPDLDAVLVELSGVADPIAIQNNFKAAKAKGHPVTDKADISQVVTLIDASTFGTDWMSWDTAGERDNWADPDDECAANRKVPELLAEQVEAANLILINKKDLAGLDQVKIASSLAKTLNEKARMEQVEYGRVAPDIIVRPKKVVETSPSVTHIIETARKGNESDGVDDIDNMSLDELRSLLWDLNGEEDQSIPDDLSLEEARDLVWDCILHYDDDDDNSESQHPPSQSFSTSVDQLGITNFVYKASRPFNTRKLLALLEKWPVPIKDVLDLSLLKEAHEERGYKVEGGQSGETSPFGGVLRSKGFCWFAPTQWHGDGQDGWRHDTAMYWSHAGKHFGINVAGKWWDTIDQQQMKQHFRDEKDDYKRILAENFVTEEFGDRRQEIVFIGVNMNEEKITQALNSCLISSELGMLRYQQGVEEYRLSH